jgi:putative acetyltransferase
MSERAIPGLLIRQEEKDETRAVEELTREAFWNRYAPGCLEHFLVHLLRKAPDFEPWHSLIALYDGAVIGHVFSSPGTIELDAGGMALVLTIGPICTLPAVFLRGIGGALMRAAIGEAKERLVRALFLTGDPKYYHRFGFLPASRFGVRYPGVPAGNEAAFFMALPLFENALDGCAGLYRASPLFEVREGPDFEAYDSSFPARKKLLLPGQL